MLHGAFSASIACASEGRCMIWRVMSPSIIRFLYQILCKFYPNSFWVLPRIPSGPSQILPGLLPEHKASEFQDNSVPPTTWRSGQGIELGATSYGKFRQRSLFFRMGCEAEQSEIESVMGWEPIAFSLSSLVQFVCFRIGRATSPHKDLVSLDTAR